MRSSPADVRDYHIDRHHDRILKYRTKKYATGLTSFFCPPYYHVQHVVTTTPQLSLRSPIYCLFPRVRASTSPAPRRIQPHLPIDQGLPFTF